MHVLTALHWVQYYVYEANSLGATNGPHTVTAVTTKVRLCCVRPSSDVNQMMRMDSFA